VRKRVKRRERASGEHVYELSFVTGRSLLKLLVGNPSYEARDAVRAVADMLRRSTSDAKPLLCMTCDHAFDGDLPTVVMIVKPFASRQGQMIVSPVCAAQGCEVVIAGVLERFRANGNPGAREIEAGSA
jgi:hypothetical protein